MKEQFYYFIFVDYLLNCNCSITNISAFIRPRITIREEDDQGATFVILLQHPLTLLLTFDYCSGASDCYLMLLKPVSVDSYCCC